MDESNLTGDDGTASFSIYSGEIITAYSGRFPDKSGFLKSLHFKKEDVDLEAAAL